MCSCSVGKSVTLLCQSAHGAPVVLVKCSLKCNTFVACFCQSAHGAPAVLVSIYTWCSCLCQWPESNGQPARGPEGASQLAVCVRAALHCGPAGLGQGQLSAWWHAAWGGARRPVPLHALQRRSAHLWPGDASISLPVGVVLGVGWYLRCEGRRQSCPFGGQVGVGL